MFLSFQSVSFSYVGNVEEHIKEEDLREQFQAYGSIRSISVIQPSKIAFIEYTHRDDAEKAVKQLSGRLMVKGVFLRVAWSKGKRRGGGGGRGRGGGGYQGNKPLIPHEMPSLPPPPPPGMLGAFYPSMAPNRIGFAPTGPGGAPPPQPFHGSGRLGGAPRPQASPVRRPRVLFVSLHLVVSHLLSHVFHAARSSSSTMEWEGAFESIVRSAAEHATTSASSKLQTQTKRCQGRRRCTSCQESEEWR